VKSKTAKEHEIIRPCDFYQFPAFFQL